MKGIDYAALDAAARQDEHLRQVLEHLIESPRFAACAAALWEKVEFVDICERAGKLINNYFATVIVKGTQITHAATWHDEQGGEMQMTGGGAVVYDPHRKVR